MPSGRKRPKAEINQKEFDEFLAAIAAGDWERAFESGVSVQLNEFPDNTTRAIIGAFDGKMRDAVTTCLKDAAACYDYPMTDVETPDGICIVRLFAALVVTAPGEELSKDDFESIGGCLEEATDGDQVVVVPRLVNPDHFVSADPMALRDILATTFFNVIDSEDDDPLERFPAGSSATELLSSKHGVLVGIKISHFPKGSPEIVSIIETHARSKESVVKFRKLVAEAAPAILHIDFPLAAGSASIKIARRMAMSKAHDFIRHNLRGVGASVTVLAMGRELRVNVMDGDGYSNGEFAIDLEPGHWEASAAADVLRRKFPSLRVAPGPEDYWNDATKGVSFQ